MRMKANPREVWVRAQLARRGVRYLGSTTVSKVCPHCSRSWLDCGCGETHAVVRYLENRR